MKVPALVEGRLDGVVLRTLWTQLGRPADELLIRDAGGSGFWRDAKRYNEAGRYQLVIGLADLEQAPCARAALDRLGEPRTQGFQLRLAVRMIESWLIADRAEFADFLGVSTAMLPTEPESLQHPKSLIHELSQRSRHRQVRLALARRGSSVVAPEYTAFMATFVAQRWDARRASSRAGSLSRALLRLLAACQALGSRP